VSASSPLTLPEELERVLRRLRLPYVRSHAPEVLATARAQRWDPAEILRVLLAEEEQGRDRATRELRRRQAGFPKGKTLDSFDESASSIAPQVQASLRTLEWIDRAENLVVAGPSGTGKSHLVEGLSHLAIAHGRRVLWFTLESLAREIARTKVDASTGRAISRIVRADLIVVDDVGMLPVGSEEAEAFYRLVDAAYEKRSLAVTSNIHPAGFDQLMPKTLATAAVDRLLHHAHVVITEGGSHRLHEATAGRGVVPLS
jgi:DNA replication protein DnaC